MFPRDYDDYLDELNAASDYRREAYGDPCPRCGDLTWGGDCARCTRPEDVLWMPMPVPEIDDSDCPF